MLELMRPANVFSLLEAPGCACWSALIGASMLPNIYSPSFFYLYLFVGVFLPRPPTLTPPHPPSCMLGLARDELESERPDLCLVLARILSASVVGGNQKI